MDRPEAPRRKSSASEAEELQGKHKAHRKTFVVGAAKSHHRIPSYGKKLNQLGKLTALTTTAEAKSPADTVLPGGGSRASFHRTASQKSLGDNHGTRRNGSVQNLQKLKRSNSQHGSTNRLTALKPMTKVGSSVKLNGGEAEPNPSKEQVVKEQDENPLNHAKRATFVIEDEDEEETDDVASSFASKAFLHEEPAQIVQHDNAAIVSQSPADIRPINVVTSNKLDVISSPNTTDSGVDRMKPRQTTIAKSSLGSGILYNQTKKLLDPEVSVDAVISRDIQVKERPQVLRSATVRSEQNTPLNSQPLTSRFLESPRKESMPSFSQLPSGSSRKENLVSASTNPQKSQIGHHSPHGSTTHLGLGSSRTQQKLLLQRASSIRDFDGEMITKEAASQYSNQSRCQKELDRIAREYQNAKRFRDPLKELSTRLYAKGLVTMHASPLRRTMTQTALTGYLADSRTPKNSQSTADLKERVLDVHRPNQESIQKVLEDLWQQGDHISVEEE